MSIRHALSRKPKPAMIIGAVAMAAALGFGIFALTGNGSDLRSGSSSKAWYTDDDGRTQFVDDSDHISPFDHNGKKAYRCYVWTCDGGKTKFVSHLERLKPERLKAAAADATNKRSKFILAAQDMEVKPPMTGERGWTEYGLPAGAAIRTPRLPSGQKGVPTPVEPK
jgi:hypothetical protein